MKHCYWLLLLLLGTTHLLAQNLNTTFRSKLVYTGQTLANVWGYVAPDGSEYALAGGSQALLIVNVTNPTNPQNRSTGSRSKQPLERNQNLRSLRLRRV